MCVCLCVRARARWPKTPPPPGFPSHHPRSRCDVPLLDVPSGWTLKAYCLPLTVVSRILDREMMKTCFDGSRSDGDLYHLRPS